MALCVERSLASAMLSSRLQLLVHRWRSERKVPRAPGVGAGEVGVIAQVHDVNACARSADFRPGVTLGPAPDGAGVLMTGRLALAAASRFAAEPFVRRLEAAVPLSPLMDDAMLELFAQPGLLPSGGQRFGANAWIGTVDSAVDAAHHNLCDASGRPRMEVYWEQQAATRRDARAEYGAVWDRRELWLAAECQQRPATNTHGLAMLDVAAGNGRENGASGVASQAKLAHVDLSSARGHAHRLGDTVRLLEGMKFVFDAAGAAPCAVNVSLGTNAGPHDGTSLAEQAMDALVGTMPGRAAMIAAGNSFAAEQHAAFELESSKPFDLAWHVSSARRQRHSVELWCSGEQHLELELMAPRHCGRCRLPRELSCRIVDETSGRTWAVIAHEQSPATGDRSVTIFLERGAPCGTWTLRVRSRTSAEGVLHAWINAEDDIAPVFLSGVDPTCTLNALACGRGTLAIGAFDAGRVQLPLAWYTSAGPTRDGRSKPDLSAPGHRIRPLEGTDRALANAGTSLAAAAATGVAAIVLGRVAELGLALSAQELRQLLICSARANPPVDAWDDRYGWGRLDAAMAIAAVEQIAGARFLSDPSP